MGEIRIAADLYVQIIFCRGSQVCIGIAGHFKVRIGNCHPSHNNLVWQHALELAVIFLRVLQRRMNKIVLIAVPVPIIFRHTLKSFRFSFFSRNVSFSLQTSPSSISEGNALYLKKPVP